MKTVPLDTFLKLIKYTPKKIGREMLGVVIVQFMDWKGKTAHIEYSVDHPQKSYFEIVDWKGYKEGDIIPLDSDRRENTIYFTPTWDNIQECADSINLALNRLYGKRSKKCSYIPKSSDISQF